MQKGRICLPCCNQIIYMTQRLLLLLIFMITSTLVSQNMQQGFDFLETGKYEEAKSFFSDVLKEFPENKTARLCYGRAVGLSGDSKNAVLVFTQLRSEFPEDFEIKLNYAEALLWDKQFITAETFYEKLVIEDSSSFPGVLGYANTLSNLKKYPESLEWVNKALIINPGNTNALISRKYIRLGYAFSLSQNKQYEKALHLLDQNLKDFPDDKDTLLNKANIYLITEAYDNSEDCYLTIAKNPKDSIVALNGLALIQHKKLREKQALKLAQKSKTKVEKYRDDNTLWLSTHERYIQALLWNTKFGIAKTEIEKLKEQFPDHNQIKSLEASLGMYTSNFKVSLDRYTSILEKDRSSFDGNLGIANAYRASGSDMKAYEFAFKTLNFYPKQPDAEKLIKTLKLSHTPHVEHKTGFTFDNGDNEAIHSGVSLEIPLSTKLKTTFGYGYRTTKNTRTSIEANAHEISAGLNYKLNGKISMITKLGLNTSTAETNNYSQILAEAILKTKPFALQNLDLGYKRELQNFNADLIDREIVMDNFYANYNLGTNFNLGWYTQYMYTTQSDDNTRNLLFTSLYYSILKKPGVKAGVNYQYITFKNQVPTLYFSPGEFNLGEIFAEIISDNKKKLFYSASTAIGKQFVDDDDASTTFRAEAKLGYQFSDRFRGNLYGKYSNIASATAAGFEFTEFGFQFEWYFIKKPLFDKKIMELKKSNFLLYNGTNM